jgi:tripartite-type tricarboxylate transporter receptor subunit TctC
MAGELYRLATKTDMLHIPYKGGGPATIDLLAGHVTIMFSNPTATVPHIKAGKLRALGVMNDKRNDALPDVPTAIEAGYPELGKIIEWYGIVVPAATPGALVARLNTDVVRALKSPDVSQRLQSIGQTVATSTPEQFAELIRAEYARWGKVVKASGAKAD